LSWSAFPSAVRRRGFRPLAPAGGAVNQCVGRVPRLEATGEPEGGLTALDGNRLSWAAFPEPGRRVPYPL
ncbi:MAG: hypothetical protein AAFO04_28195, partial [Cyanobacteria bacterium J06592_8]